MKIEFNYLKIFNTAVHVYYYYWNARTNYAISFQSGFLLQYVFHIIFRNENVYAAIYQLYYILYWKSYCNIKVEARDTCEGVRNGPI